MKDKAKKARFFAVLLCGLFLVSCGGDDDILRAPSANEVSRTESGTASEETSGTVSGITLPDDIF